MSKFYLILILFLVANNLFGQEKNCNCIEELDNVSELIENAKSYRIEIKRTNKEAELKRWKEEIKREIESDSLSNFFCVGYLQKYISLINDRHNEITFLPEKISSNVPDYLKAIDSTKNLNDGISGIYYEGSDKIFVQKENENTWYGVILKSNADEWTEGKIRLRINKTTTGEFELFEYYKNGLLFYQKDVKIKDGRIHSTFWNKENKYFFNKNHQENFSYTSLNPSFDYIGIKTLKRTNTLMKEADSFYATKLGKLSKGNLIIDLRNNNGGAIKQAQPLLKSLKSNDDIKRIFVIINFKTSSAAELTALELKKDKRTILVGENSRGMLTYGYGNQAFTTKTNCSEYYVVLSTKRVNSRLNKYEYEGLQPDYYLNNNSDWIDQILNIEAVEK